MSRILKTVLILLCLKILFIQGRILSYYLPPVVVEVPSCPQSLIKPCLSTPVIIPSDAIWSTYDTNCSPTIVTSSSPYEPIILLVSTVGVNFTAITPEIVIIGYSPLVLCYPYEYYLISRTNDTTLNFTRGGISSNESSINVTLFVGESLDVPSNLVINKTTYGVTTGCSIDTVARSYTSYEDDYIPTSSIFYGSTTMQIKFNIADNRIRFRTKCLVVIYTVDILPLRMTSTRRITPLTSNCSGTTPRIVDYISPTIVLVSLDSKCLLNDLVRVETNGLSGVDEEITDVYRARIYHRRQSLSQCRIQAYWKVPSLSSLYDDIIDLYHAASFKCGSDIECKFTANNTIIAGVCKSNGYCSWSDITPLMEASRLVGMTITPTYDRLDVSTKVDRLCRDVCPTTIVGPIVDEWVCSCERYITTFSNIPLGHRSVHGVTKVGIICVACDGERCNQLNGCYNGCLINGTSIMTSEAICSSYSFSCASLIEGICITSVTNYTTIGSWTTISDNGIISPISLAGNIIATGGQAIPAQYIIPQYVESGVTWSSHPFSQWNSIWKYAFQLNRVDSMNDDIRRVHKFATLLNDANSPEIVVFGMVSTVTTIIEGLIVNVSGISMVRLHSQGLYILLDGNYTSAEICIEGNCTTHTTTPLNVSLGRLALECVSSETVLQYIVNIYNPVILDRRYIIIGNLFLVNQTLVITSIDSSFIVEGSVTMDNVTLNVSTVPRNVPIVIINYEGNINISTTHIEGIVLCEAVSLHNSSGMESHNSSLILLVTNNNCNDNTPFPWIYVGSGIAGGLCVIFIIIIVIYVTVKRVRKTIAPYHDRPQTISLPRQTTTENMSKNRGFDGHL